MKKAISLILAALLCAATTVVAGAEEVIEEAPATTETVVEETVIADEAVAEEVVADEAVAEEVVADEEAVATETQVAPYDAELIVLLLATEEIVVTPEFVDAVLSSDAIPTVESLLALATEFEVVLDEEQATLVLDVIGAFLIMPLAEELPAEEIAIEEIAVEEVAIEEVAVEEPAIEEEVVEEEVSKYPCILEETPTFGLFSKMYNFLYRG